VYHADGSTNAASTIHRLHQWFQLMTHKKIRRQKPVKGGRERMSSGVLKEIDNAVAREAARHSVSKSFVISVILAKAFGIKDQETY
jgi:hypothetical protein